MSVPTCVIRGTTEGNNQRELVLNQGGDQARRTTSQNPFFFSMQKIDYCGLMIQPGDFIRLFVAGRVAESQENMAIFPDFFRSFSIAIPSPTGRARGTHSSSIFFRIFTNE